MEETTGNSKFSLLTNRVDTAYNFLKCLPMYACRPITHSLRTTCIVPKEHIGR